MAIKAVFFDLYNTLARFDPPREEQQARACRELGLTLRPELLPRAYLQADDFMARENACAGAESSPWGAYFSKAVRIQAAAYLLSGSGT